jgi:PD-(D/E)XK nuclease superfamily
MSEEKQGLLLPKQYKAREARFEKYNGMQKLSYSQVGSFTDPLYRKDYIRQYMFGIPSEDTIWTSFGSAAGIWLETNGKECSPLLNEESIASLKALPRPEKAAYEYPIAVVVDTEEGQVILEGYIDELEYVSDTEVIVKDYKTGSYEKKQAQYASEDYQQTTLYSYHMETEGYKVVKSCVWLLSRKGNGRAGHPVRLENRYIEIPTPYSRERAEKYFEKVRKTAKEVSDLYKIFLKYNK